MTGAGTELDPYIITSKADLQAIEDELDAYYELGGNVDASGAAFTPITAFTGQLDGKDYTISDMVVSSTYGGLFYTNGGTITRVKLTSVDITGTQAGSIACYNTGTITKCSSTGAISASGQVGGFVQWNNGGTIDQCWTSCAITSSGAVDRAGGFVQWNNAGTITNCYATGSMTGSGAGWAGGFAQINDGTLDDCYSIGAMAEYSIGQGGFCQSDTGTITNCFWDTETSGEASSDGGTGKTTAQMKTQSTFTDAGWNFTAIWGIATNINSSYPHLLVFGYPTVGNIAWVGNYLVGVDYNGNRRKILGDLY